MAGHDVPAQLVAGLQRALQVDAPARPPFIQRRLGQRLVGDIDGKRAAGAGWVHLGGRQAGAVAGDRGADGDALRRIAAADREPAAVARGDLADVGDDACEHGAENITSRKRRAQLHPVIPVFPGRGPGMRGGARAGGRCCPSP